MAFIPTLEEVKNYLRIDYDILDGRVLDMLNSAVNDVERYTSFRPRTSVSGGVLTIEDYSTLIINEDEALLLQTLPTIPDGIKQGILDRVAFLFGNTGDLTGNRDDDWYHLLRSYSCRSII